ncbi:MULTISPECIES: hypothetical protein [Methylobacterium]|jgi:hypothetical protein|uniref:Uncharacterized protein n=1 Tax=Methylobacterium bullatum TaxID=570505 RepID=A0A679KHG7_9HYPH|nr:MULTISPECIES: hypothetical protein [Methylobacterium]KQO53191.1 hypothetical protein ASF08_18215 [Methylobacterium sp. Leaf85]KQP51588.1 hypothetical protein ASF34_19095 [Methylobacterium sp. Leaf106]MBD8903524.1 hypothetical protein [Methylobacterium bullatum]TXN25446.1 hypothetical protein FV220_18720 [Methylobacterium sp. WL19]CAA2144198.1 hypothetical protein MBLL_03316 [Methylobacterium bullatum]
MTQLLIGAIVALGAILSVARVRQMLNAATRAHFPRRILLVYILVRTLIFGAVLAGGIWLVSWLMR